MQIGNACSFRMTPPLQRLIRYFLVLCIPLFISSFIYTYLPQSAVKMPARPLPDEIASTLLAEKGLQLRSIEIIQSLWAGYGEICRVHAVPAGSSSPSQDPQSYILKLVTPPPTRADDEGHTRKILSYRVEQYFYTHLAPQMPAYIPIASCLSSMNEHHAENTSLTAMLLSDLRHKYPVAGEKRSSLNETQVHAALNWLSSFHGFWWPRAKSLNTTSLVLPPLQEVQRSDLNKERSVWLNGGYTYLSTRRTEYTTLASDYDAEWNEALTDWVDGESVSIAEIAAAFLAPKTSGYSPIQAYQTLIHGDVKSENLFTSENGEEVAFYDFQYTGLGLGVCDLAKFFTCSVPLLMLLSPPDSTSTSNSSFTSASIPRELPMQDGEKALLHQYWENLRKVGQQEYKWDIFIRHWETALVDWLRFQASWGFWGNTEWLEARVHSILKDEEWRAALISNVDKSAIEKSR
jgi:thiamine kinase-like enzyme